MSEGVYRSPKTMRTPNLADVARERALRRAGCAAWSRGRHSGVCPVCGHDDVYILVRQGLAHRSTWIALDQVSA